MGTLTLTGMAAGLPSGEQILGPATMTGVSVVSGLTGGTLSVGDNTFPTPPGSTPTAVAVFLGLGGSTATVKVRTNLNFSDGGLPVGPFSSIGWAAWPLPAGTTEVVLNASQTVTGVSVAFI